MKGGLVLMPILCSKGFVEGREDIQVSAVLKVLFFINSEIIMMSGAQPSARTPEALRQIRRLSWPNQLYDLFSCHQNHTR